MTSWEKAKPEFLDAEQNLPAPAPTGRPSGRLSDHAREGDVVILDKWGNVYELNQRTTGDKRQDAQAFIAGIGPLPSVRHSRRELEEKQQQRPIRLPTGAQQGGLVAQQMWAVRRLQTVAQQRHEQQRRAYNQQRRDEERRERQQAEKQKADAGQVDIERYRADPEYRRQVQQAQSFKSPDEKQRDRENAARAFVEQQSRQR